LCLRHTLSAVAFYYCLVVCPFRNRHLIFGLRAYISPARVAGVPRPDHAAVHGTGTGRCSYVANI
jgi:hypothetical protein